MTTTEPETPGLIDALLLFGEETHPGSCCACCDGFCAWAELGGPDVDWPSVMVRFTVDEIEYLSDRFIAVRRDVLTNLPEDDGKLHHAAVTPAWAVVPTEKPPPSTHLQSARILDRLEEAGLTRHGGDLLDEREVLVHAGLPVIHLYRGDQHVGWTLIAKNDGITVDDLPIVRKLAEDLGLDIRIAASALHLVRGADQ